MDKYKDLASRALWTAAQAGVAVVTVEALDVPLAYAGIAAAVLSAAKSWLATKVGNPQTVTFD